MSIMDFRGVYSATFTPLDKEGNVDLDMLAKLSEFHAANGLVGLYLCGSTGEGPMLSNEARKAVTSTAVDVAGDRLKVIAHVGHTCTDDAIELARAAETAGLNVLPYGLLGGQPLRADALTGDADGVSFVLCTPAGRVRVASGLPGHYNVMNMLCAAGMALAGGVPVDVVAQTLCRARPRWGR